MTVIWALIGYTVGVIFSILMFCPMKNWQEGYDMAKKTYGDWSKGFNCGYDAAAEYYTDYKQGFHDGWLACEKNSAGESKEKRKGVDL